VEKNSDLNSFEMFGRLCVLLDSAPWYRDQRIRDLGFRFIPAIEHGKVRYWMRDGSLIGFATWCYMTFEEAETREYSGREVFSRTSGDQLWVMDMVAVDSVLYIARDMRRFLSDVTDHDVAHWKRPDGRQGNAWRLKHG
jgi:hemolysin-activating ACP:hemolysin acyltransferase